MQVIVAAACLLAGCGQVFGLDRVPDAAPPPDLPIGFDYDTDGVFFGDVCPAIVDPDQLDEDGDGVGNACDPHPGQRDEVVIEEFFDGDAPGWTAPGAWTRAPGAWTSPPAFDGKSTFAYTSSRELYRPTFLVAFTIHAYAAVNEIREMVVFLDSPASAGDCAFRYNPFNTSSKSQLVIHVAGTPDGTGVADWVFGTRYVGTYTRSLTSVCTASGQRNEAVDVVETFATTPLITIDRMQVTLHHVTIYQVVP